MPGAGADASRAERFRGVFRRCLLDALVEADASLAEVRDGTDAEQLLARGSEGHVLERCRGALEGITQLDLSWYGVGEKVAMEVLAGALGGMTAIRQLDLGHNSLGAEGVRALAGALGGMTAITTLDLGGNSLGAEGVRALAGALGGMTALRELDLGSNWLVFEGAMEALAGALGGMTATSYELDYVPGRGRRRSGGGEGRAAARRRGANVNTSIIVNTSIPPTPTPTHPSTPRRAPPPARPHQSLDLLASGSGAGRVKPGGRYQPHGCADRYSVTCTPPAPRVTRPRGCCPPRRGRPLRCYCGFVGEDGDG